VQSSQLRRLAIYAVAIASPAIALLLTLWLEQVLSHTIAVLFFLAVTVTTWYGGIQPGLVSIVLSTLAINYYFTPPKYAFVVAAPADAVRLLIFIAVALIISRLTTGLQHNQKIIAQLQEKAALEAERQKNREALLRSEERWQLAIAGNNDGIWDHDLLTNEHFLSPRCTELLGYAYTDIDTFEKWLRCVHPEDLQPLQTAFQQHITKKTSTYTCEYRIRCQDGHYKWVLARGKALWNEDGQAVRAVGSITDISDRKKAEFLLYQAKAELEMRVTERTAALAQQTQTLQESERRWRSLLENVQLAVVGLNRSGVVEYINPFFLEMTGYTEAEVMGKLWFTDFIPLDKIQESRSIFQEILKHNFHPYYQNIILTKAGEERIITWNNTLLHDQSGNVIGTMSIGEDITQRQIVDRMKNEFISIVSHELRTPLTAIRGSLGLMASGALDDKPDKSKQLIHIAAEQSDRLVRLVNDILDLRRLESGKFSFVLVPCDVSMLLAKATDVMRSDAEEHHLSLEIESAMGQVLADTDAILQTLTNLISNAIKFSPPHRTIVINAIEENNFTANGDSPMVRFFIRDQGRGIPGEMIERIFDPFQQVDASDSRDTGGTGLGLAICRKIVQQHGGQIWVESALSQGSTFYFTLPSAIEP
jgi:PAS domain S-box-containing protein